MMDEPHATDGVESDTDTPPLRAVPYGLFSAWRRMVNSIAGVVPRVVNGARSAVRTWIGQWRRVREYHRHASEPWTVATAADRETAAAVGTRAFLFGVVIAGIVTAQSSGLWGPAVVTTGTEVLWAGARFIIIAMLMPRGTITRTRLSIAFLAGLLPYAFGATWPLRMVALGGSALLTRRGLLGAGVSARDVRVTVGWSFGGQAAILVGGWLVRAVIALITLS
ncbi:MAG: hypothetical protein Q7W51_07510 [Coriobacteriia bacterium]|nr:hypothetical protein [Coriobacteriia bacterium]